MITLLRLATFPRTLTLPRMATFSRPVTLPRVATFSRTVILPREATLPIWLLNLFTLPLWLCYGFGWLLDLIFLYCVSFCIFSLFNSRVFFHADFGGKTMEAIIRKGSKQIFRLNAPATETSSTSIASLDGRAFEEKVLL